MNIVFWSEEDGCGTTSGMAAVASVCADAWNLNTMLLQSSNQRGDLYQKLGTGINSRSLKKEKRYGMQDEWEVLTRLAERKKLTEEKLMERMVPVIRGRMYYLPQGEYQKREKYPKAVLSAIREIVSYAQQMSDLTFIDCGSGRDEISDFLLAQADVAVVSLSQERQNLDAYFQNRHILRENVIYLINQYHQESIYNKKNINRLYRLYEEQLAVIPDNPVFRHISGKGKTERFVRRHIQCRNSDYQSEFMKELVKTSALILRSARIKYLQPTAAGSFTGAGGRKICRGDKKYRQIRSPPFS